MPADERHLTPQAVREPLPERFLVDRCGGRNVDRQLDSLDFDHAAEDARRELGLIAVRAQSSPEALSDLSAEIRKREAELAALRSRVADLRQVIVDTGALAAVEDLIEALREESIAALDALGLADPTDAVLRQLIVAATKRKG